LERLPGLLDGQELGRVVVLRLRLVEWEWWTTVSAELGLGSGLVFG
jgi:hypothetical protein